MARTRPLKTSQTSFTKHLSGRTKCHCAWNIWHKVQSSILQSWHIKSDLFSTGKFAIAKQAESLITPALSSDCEVIADQARRAAAFLPWPWLKGQRMPEKGTGMMNGEDGRRVIYKGFHFLSVFFSFFLVVPVHSDPSHARFSPFLLLPGSKVLRNGLLWLRRGSVCERWGRESTGSVETYSQPDTSSPHCRIMTQCKAALWVLLRRRHLGKAHIAHGWRCVVYKANGHRPGGPA